MRVPGNGLIGIRIPLPNSAMPSSPENPPLLGRNRQPDSGFHFAGRNDRGVYQSSAGLNFDKLDQFSAEQASALFQRVSPAIGRHIPPVFSDLAFSRPVLNSAGSRPAPAAG